VIEELREWLDRLLERFQGGERRGLVLTLLAVVRLKENGREITPESVVEEAHKIMSERPDVDWGVSREEYTVELATKLLDELADAGVIEPIDPMEPPPYKKYRVRKYSDGDPLAEIYARFGSLLLYGGPPGARA